jgi:F0F1-type ATP synthase assembly protein I
LSTRKPPEEKPDGRASGDWVRVVRDLAPYLGIGTSLAVTVLLGIGGGYWLDARFGTRPWFLLLGGVLGLALALYQFFKTVAGLDR